MSLRGKYSRLSRRIVELGALAALGAFALGAKGAAPSPPAAQASGYVTLARGLHPLARPENDLGRLDAGKRIENLALVFKPSPEQARERDALAEAVSDPASPSFRQFLTPEQYAARFGAKPADIARTVAWLEAQGLDVVSTSRLGARVTFSGAVSRIEAAFHTEMHRYQVSGETHYAMASAPSVPAALADVVLALHNAHDFYVRPMLRSWKVAPQATCPGFDLACAGTGFVPPDWTKTYDVPSTYDGSGVTIMVVGVADVAQGDLTAYRTAYLPGAAADPIVKTVVPNTGPATAGAQGTGMEAVLDLEWASSIAPKATINYVYTGGNDGNVFDAIYYAIEQSFGGVLSVSWGGCEAGTTPADADVVQQFGTAADLLGITFLSAAGDSGAASCVRQGSGGLYPSFPASFPGVTAVGGTQFPTSGGLFNGSGNATGYSTTETVWNESNDPTAITGVASGGGGISVMFSRPSYQTTTSAPACAIVGSLPVSGLNAAEMRQVPDVSFSAAGGQAGYGYYIECTNPNILGGGDCSSTAGTPTVIEIGGTSAATPAFAGVVALASQAAGTRLGNINPLLYQLPASVFHDITTGNNEVKCTASDPGCPAGGSYGYAAAAGYDCATGLGSIDAANLITAVKAMTATTTTLAAVTSPLAEGTPVPLTATVAGTGTPTGTVTFMFQSYLANGAPDLSWTLGTATVTGGTASPATPFAIPPGMVGSGGLDLVAAYGGDPTHLPSVSPKVHVTFGPVSFCVSPGTTTVAPGGTATFTATGGVPPVRWYIYNLGADDTTAKAVADGGSNGSSLDEQTGVLTAGTGQPGYVLVQAVDSAGAETFAEVTVGAPSGTAPWAGDAGGILLSTCGAPAGDGGAGNDAGVPGGGNDGGPIAPGGGDDGGGVLADGGLAPTGDGGAGAYGDGGSSSSGCGCTTVGRSDAAPAGVIGGIVLGLGLVARRRRARKGR